MAPVCPEMIIRCSNQNFSGLDKVCRLLFPEGVWLNDARNISFNARLARSGGKPFEIGTAVSDTCCQWCVRNTDLIILEAAVINSARRHTDAVLRSYR